MTVYIVRHAKAGSRGDWHGPDDLRPLTKNGRRQADWVAAQLEGEPVKRIVSSPFLRCVESVQPLADRLGLIVETSAALAEGAPVDGMLALMAGVAADNGVVCSHGDMIPEVLDTLIRVDGLQLGSDYPVAKGSIWVLDGDARPFVRARYVEPPRH